MFYVCGLNSGLYYVHHRWVLLSAEHKFHGRIKHLFLGVSWSSILLKPLFVSVLENNMYLFGIFVAMRSLIKSNEHLLLMVAEAIQYIEYCGIISRFIVCDMYTECPVSTYTAVQCFTFNWHILVLYRMYFTSYNNC